MTGGRTPAGRFGALRHHVSAGILNEQSLHAELGQILAGDRPGRESPDERILLWHRGLSILDIAVAQLILERAVAADTGTMLRTTEAMIPCHRCSPACARRTRPNWTRARC